MAMLSGCICIANPNLSVSTDAQRRDLENQQPDPACQSGQPKPGGGRQVEPPLPDNYEPFDESRRRIARNQRRDWKLLFYFAPTDDTPFHANPSSIPATIRLTTAGETPWSIRPTLGAQNRKTTI